MATITQINDELALDIRNFSFWYNGSSSPSLKNINMPVATKKVTALIGPSGCGKSTLLRSINRIHDLYPGNRYEGEILFHGKNILDKKTDLIELRTKIGMIFQQPTAFPMSIKENVEYGLKLQGVKDKQILAQTTSKSLKGANIWEEVKDRLNDDATSLSGGQRQRLCIARAIAVSPDILLFDEPTSALDPISTIAIEELINRLKEKYTILIVTHNMQQATRISDYTAFMYLGDLVEFGNTKQIFEAPREKLLQEYVGGKFG
ncbi:MULTISPECIES: phosphate ABC transporter ATP-binding protein PstB [Campylobacter]|uniref:Phosphate ABC transporter, ATP-binding protein n=1 Tax=Campylobacter hominis (strain ATCC BAA-381 / DSM 21671 / CCUG 45161 / LMG 19568 / NCTC 13146 / CH001A) TaxID=360107 RepID=A7I0G3_CAMHC|nr:MULTISPECIES: phosphate ABC transporter ATP-binding protein PstB [Campylobacter]ABS52317.1 phosphate ABC transporter, ATP-binding protein [Campylobacter hominis ATCC BAA-381]MCI6641368.1 phosphate ABC transporter ATP-binding protein PstB [Campylobacter sp.]MDD7422498.1 phosphate ABC transporter ATP-binding protein PstB [Campylobacter hominis]MDY3117150.1 phosphate ABC transporter ATP-binding protein PstB [Campylobacter hominis]UAK85160.1 phosphate ABC transporter ATP-binding protein PstB [C